MSEQENDKLNATILFVDDEKNILSSLKRLFRKVTETVFTAESGAEGLEILGNEKVDIVVSDMRMPEMDGAQFLEKVAENWPGTVRILLTGYADITSTINAINNGSIYRYISKPWDDEDIVLSVRQALEQKQIKEERDRLQILTNQQNDELNNLNVTLENRVKARTEEVQQTMEQLEVTYETLKENYDKTINVISNIIGMRESTNTNKIPELVVKIANNCDIQKDQVKNIYFASLLRNIGKISLSDELNKKPFEQLTKDEMAKVRQHPVIGQGILMSLEYLQESANIIRSQFERNDGQGFPDSLSGNDIPLGARIIRLASDFVAYQNGQMSPKHLSIEEAREKINRERGMRYDSDLVDKLFEILDVSSAFNLAKDKVNEKVVESSMLLNGMILSRDLAMKNGSVLLLKGHVLSSKFINAILKMEKTMNEKMTIYILITNEENDNV